MNFKKCSKCGKNTIVDIERFSASDTGRGCTNCKTAIEKQIKCFSCKNTLTIYLAPNQVDYPYDKFSVCSKHTEYQSA